VEMSSQEIGHYEGQPTRCVVLTCVPLSPIFIVQVQAPHRTMSSEMEMFLKKLSGLATMRVNQLGALSLLVLHHCQPVFIAQAQAPLWPMSSEMFLKKLSSGLYVILPVTSPTSADRVSYPLNDKRWLSSPERIVCGGERIHYYYHVAALSVMMRCPITLRRSME